MIPTGKLPAHVGIIMDGNGRWARLRGLPRIEGHRVGAERAKEIIEASADLGIGCLTLYTFSMENWQRPGAEVSTLMKILELYLKKELAGLVKQNIVFKTIGETWRLPKNVQELLRKTEEQTASNTGMKLVIALSYGGRNEMLRAVRELMKDGVSPDDLTEDIFVRYLDTAGIPDPDLIIRTSGELRLSNFLLWQSAYAELYFTDTLWPDFDREELLAALRDFQGRERRFGAVSSKTNAS